MSISQDSAATIVCKEIFDGASNPSHEEVLEYARRLGIDPDTEPHLLSLAQEGLMAALPEGWLPCYHEASRAWYYYQTSTGNRTWEHPLDAVYKELVEQARAGNVKPGESLRQISFEEDSKTTAKDLDSHEQATLSKEKNNAKQSTKANPPPTRIPTKLAPLKKDKIDGARKRDERSRMENPLATNRTGRDYTNLRFQDPKFYECPKLLEAGASGTHSNVTTPIHEIDLKEVLKRSESLSPRHEKDWEQLSSKFSSEENIIDIDKLSMNALARSERPEKFDKEKHPSQLGQQKELTLSGGGTMFLKSNRSRDTTPSHEGTKLDDFRTVTIPDESYTGDKLKSILREKQSEDDDRPVDEERKSVRFDIEKDADIKFTYSRSEDESDSDPEDQDSQMLALLSNKDINWSSLQKTNSQSPDEANEDAEDKVEEMKYNVESKKNGKIVGKRFVVQNVSENEHRKKFGVQAVSEKEHRLQMSRDILSRDSLSRDSSLDYTYTNKFNKIKNIDLVSKSETDYSDSERRKNKSKDFSRTEQTDDDDTSDISRINPEFELSRRERNEIAGRLEQYKNLEETKIRLDEQYEKDVEMLKKEYEEKLERTRKELEEKFLEQKKLMDENVEDRMKDLTRELVEKAFVTRMDDANSENLRKMKTELEISYEKEKQEMLENMKTELDEKKRELLELRIKEMGKLEDEHERDLSDEKHAKLNRIELSKLHSENIEALKKEFDDELEELRAQLQVQQKEKIAEITEEHEKHLCEILRDFKITEDRTRKMHKQRLEKLRAEFAQELEKESRKHAERAIHQENIEFEKMRCEKRLLQDKYTALKEKYMKLKKEVRAALERRSKRKESYTTASETERSTSTRTRTERTESSDQSTPQLRNTRSSLATTMTTTTTTTTPHAKPHEPTGNERSEESHDPDEPHVQKANSGFQKSAAARNLKFDTDDATSTSEANANTTKKSFKRLSTTAGNNNNVNNNELENPVENIRKQLEKLEDLGDQLPSNETAYTLRYPFQDKAPANASSELEFFRHRIHVERDSVKRAREALRHQENLLQGRQKAWKQRSASATLEQLVQEERELSDMEVNLHRTKSLLGEKVIHLRHLEQSLERMVNSKKNENDTSSKNDDLTLSDMSSVSSGVSSTDLVTDIDKPDQYQESTEIIASLENLNSEIREIWGVLNKRQDTDAPPPPTLMYSYLRWLRFHHLAAQSNNIQGTFGTPNIQSNILSQLTGSQPPITQNIIAQYGPNSGFTTSVCTVEKNSSNLMERTWSLRDWLRQACIENADQSRSVDSLKNPQLIEKFASKRHSFSDANTRFTDVDSMYLHVFLNQFKKTCFR
ncbi:paramyosin isoform X2 [Ceratina calcarata]|uniref:Paramyosin isoform X2 n=1 Tax=Ceratina calcarata TaxID=156304 RepID=A0AAJ7J9M9_9HYME|nr:paramyosin isoform X2 [Ceratina calcarata]